MGYRAEGCLIHQRLWNWGCYRWRDLMSSGPDGSCVNPLYQMGPSSEGWAGDDEVGADPQARIIALRTEPARQEAVEVDEDDAEVMQGWIAQLPQGHRATLSRRYVTRERVDPREAIRALEGLMDKNYETVREMQRRLRG